MEAVKERGNEIWLTVFGVSVTLHCVQGRKGGFAQSYGWRCGVLTQFLGYVEEFLSSLQRHMLAKNVSVGFGYGEMLVCGFCVLKLKAKKSSSIQELLGLSNN